jgi:mycothiol synthase
VERLGRLDPDAVSEVLELARAAAAVNHTYPFSEQVVLRLRHGGDPPAVHLLARDRDRRLVGYAHVDPTDEVNGAVAELVVHPAARRRGWGHALAAAAVEVAEESDPHGRLRLWAHGDHPGAAALARSLGFARSRVLWQMGRSLRDPVPAPTLPAGVTLRTFRPGEDDDAWLAVNARAFAGHPEQGRWTTVDLRLRLAEPWFDPAGFLLAVRERDGRLLGFHWTKIHRGTPAHPDQPIGEVYVLGVDPAVPGAGLGTALTLAGLGYLRERGLARVMLYVDEDNLPAVALYTKLGFRRWSVDVMFARAGAA